MFYLRVLQLEWVSHLAQDWRSEAAADAAWRDSAADIKSIRELIYQFNIKQVASSGVCEKLFNKWAWQMEQSQTPNPWVQAGQRHAGEIYAYLLI